MARPRAEVISEMVDSGLFSDDEIRAAAGGAQQSQDQGQTEQGVLGAVGAALGSRPELQPYGQAGIPKGGFGPLEAAQQTLAAPMRIGQTLAGGPNMLGELTSEGLGYASAKITPNPSPMAQKIADYGAAAAGSMVANAPFMIPGGPTTKYSTELGPASGKPGIAARIKQTRTGVDAGEFERLRRDPKAFFSRADRKDLGSNIGEAKEKSGINLGVKGNDLKTLTKENLSKTRNLAGASNKAQDQIADDIQAAIDLLGPEAPESEILNLAKISPDKASVALDGVNARLSKLLRTEGQGGTNFQKWTAIKSNLGRILEEVAPGVRQANKDFSRVSLRDKFMEPFPVNLSGTMSKIGAIGGGTLAGGVGAAIAGGPGALIGAGLYQAARSPFVAGFGTAVRGLADKSFDDILTETIRGFSNRAAYANFIDKFTTRDNQ